MQLLSFISTFALFSLSVYAATNGPCNVSGTPGVCIATASCASSGGTSHTGYCPNDPTDIKCCTKSSCGSGGSCKWTSQCSGNTQAGLCPGPTDFKCCLGSGSGGSPGRPPFPTGNCKPHVVNHAWEVVDHFPGKVTQIWCYANKPNSDHNQGLALDFMVGLRSPNGQPLAEWVMNNHAALQVTYVIWGQKIWDIAREGSPKPWAQWRQMEDRGDSTANHWDHVHVSFKPA
ncbi:MAG: hypothetical protein M1839_003525 [Geoglossum umbratile]|nr:MAG: hypothetical protein M1839_003525 [Geoglossum umbratile]